MKKLLLASLLFGLSIAHANRDLVEVYAHEQFDSARETIIIQSSADQLLVFDARYNDYYILKEKNLNIRAKNIVFRDYDGKKVVIKSGFDSLGTKSGTPSGYAQASGIKSGTSHHGNDGRKGRTGAKGDNGRHAGNVTMNIMNFEGEVHFDLRGQSGQQGQKGGAGQKGAPGAWGRNRGGNALCTNAVSPHNGGNGGRGGDGGRGGQGGKSGNGGDLTITILDLGSNIDLEQKLNTLITYNLDAGKPGAGGISGNPGVGGELGLGGKRSHCGGGADNGVLGQSGSKDNSAPKGPSGVNGKLSIQVMEL